jgi:hypothetical protein
MDLRIRNNPGQELNQINDLTMCRVILFQFETPQIKVDIQAYFENENLIIEGYDIGKRVKDWFGDSDYEYKTTIFENEVQKLYHLMQVKTNDKTGLLKAIADRFNTNSCYSEFGDFLTKNNIQSEKFSWT